ncbi:hypothetical protein QE152_g1879 [Popillia japonica]|uniref:Uncharacterized protein n=1 Tax=Popillia japonica TaxID=7064 RepID=A0AAW1N304_POPJA
MTDRYYVPIAQANPRTLEELLPSQSHKQIPGPWRSCCSSATSGRACSSGTQHPDRRPTTSVPGPSQPSRPRTARTRRAHKPPSVGSVLATTWTTTAGPRPYMPTHRRSYPWSETANQAKPCQVRNAHNRGAHQSPIPPIPDPGKTPAHQPGGSTSISCSRPPVANTADTRSREDPGPSARRVHVNKLQPSTGTTASRRSTPATTASRRSTSNHCQQTQYPSNHSRPAAHNEETLTRRASSQQCLSQGRAGCYQRLQPIHMARCEDTRRPRPANQQARNSSRRSLEDDHWAYISRPIWTQVSQFQFNTQIKKLSEQLPELAEETNNCPTSRNYFPSHKRKNRQVVVGAQRTTPVDPEEGINLSPKAWGPRVSQDCERTQPKETEESADAGNKSHSKGQERANTLEHGF